jgi:ABC-type lipoprotein export system ATPase subunit
MPYVVWFANGLSKSYRADYSGQDYSHNNFAMSEHNYAVDIESTIHVAGVPKITGHFGRITVLLGANGTGKSRVLRRLRDTSSSIFGEDRSPVYIEGGRVIVIPNAIGIDLFSFNQFGTLQLAYQTFRTNRLTPTSNRSRDAFYLLARKDAVAKEQHSDAVTEWQRNGCAGTCPSIEETQLEKLFKLFSEVFPEIRIRLEGEGNQITCHKNSQTYPTNELSDGERQVLFILADIALTAEPNSVIFADEPELNLNSQLAVRLWDAIENYLPDAVFVYGTHNISFAMRPSVDRIFVLSGRGEAAIQVESVLDIDPDDAREFLGAIPAILAAPAAIAVEGEDSSFDSGFYKWLLGRPELVIVPLGGCTDVKAAVTRTGIWDKLASSVRLAGIIDRDYRDDAFLIGSNEPCTILDYHEAESYLCHPEIFCAIAQALGTAERMPTELEIEQQIINYFEQNIVSIALNRMAYRAQIRLNVSLQRSTFKGITDEAAIRELIKKEADLEAEKAYRYIGAEATLKIFDEELQRCQQALSDKDIDRVLQLAEGKELLARLARRAGCKDTAALARAAYKHLDVNNFEKLRSLMRRVQNTLAL